MSVPAVSGHHPNQFHPPPFQAGPFALYFRPMLPFRPTPGFTSSVTLQLGFLSQSAQLFPVPPTPPLSPFQMSKWEPDGTTAAGVVEPSPGHGGQMQLVATRAAPMQRNERGHVLFCIALQATRKTT